MTSDRAGVPRRRRCYLVRHGHVEYFDTQGRPLDPRTVSLSPRGEQQVAALGEVLQDTHFDRVLVSDYPRAQQTLERLLSGRNVPIEIRTELREIRAGRLRDIPPVSLRETVTDAYRGASDPGATFLGGEYWSDFSQRVLGTLLELLEDDSWESALIVSHDAVNRIVLAWATGTGLPGIAAFEQDNACLNVMDIDPHGKHRYCATLRTLNFTPYNPHKAGLHDTVLESLYHAIAPSKPST
ncbi:histidine phosphatase family protein [Pseudomonas putida]|uniref:Histidine phosphatase family protein n=1 Tax=Pseudomonas putida TaxID=303 RepID=A0A6I6XXA9_PSEPU|nr:histidine phosphatase family protein [Pseudomonas putida]QHG64632.1 histidine phosphatase family protein [Pseudomonas putida]